MRTRRVALLAISIAMAIATLLLTSCAQTTQTSTGVLAPTPTAAPTPLPTPTAVPTAAPTPTAVPKAEASGMASTPASVRRIVAGEQIAAEDLGGYVAWIEAKLERPLPEVPTVTGMDRDELLALVPEGRFVPGDTWELLIALGLVEADADRLAADEVRRLDVRGACCPIVVRDAGSAAFNEMLLVHELTHAADDPSGSLAAQRPREFVSMSIALIEGNAHRVAFDYADDVLAITYPDFEPPSPVFTDPEHPDLPAAVRQVVEFPYDEGQQFTRELVERGGEAALIDAFLAPPVSSEHIIDIDSYLANELPTEVATPAASRLGEVVGAGSLGAFLLQQVLAESLDGDDALALASQWDGDSYVLFRDGQRRCITVRFVVETEAGAAQLVDLLEAQAESPLQLIWSRCSDDVPSRGARSD